ncbi:MAG: phosphoenolpyruvate--protein phosphotransferase, partial [Acholeplasmataceae bacterium]
MLHGFGVSHGIAIGKAFFNNEIIIDIPKNKIEDIDFEIQRFVEAKLETTSDLNALRNTLNVKSTFQGIINAHIQMINDVELENRVIEEIKKNQNNATFALDIVMKKLIDQFQNLEDPFYQERVIDLKDVRQRLLGKLLNISHDDFIAFQEPAILICHELNPSQAMQLNPKFIKGILIEQGGKYSHTAIIAKSLNIPTIIGVNDAYAIISSHDSLIIDGTLGEVLVNPSSEIVERYQIKKDEALKRIALLTTVKEQEAKTKDQFKFPILANINTPLDILEALKSSAEGVGLYRTEFLYMNRTSLPTEEEQILAYKHILNSFRHQKVIIRTLDVGGDKHIPTIDMIDEVNPFLGLRGIRFSFNHKKLLKTQLRALLRASTKGSLHIMFPMISTMDELEEAMNVLNECKKELNHENYAFSSHIKIGMMIEVPSAALLANQFADKVDFLSIGTNDLIQYTFAADRTNKSVSHLYQSLHPAVLRLIKLVVDAANEKGKSVSVCGEMASDIKGLKVLLGLGVHEVSIHPQDVLAMKYELSQRVQRGHYYAII